MTDLQLLIMIVFALSSASLAASFIIPFYRRRRVGISTPTPRRKRALYTRAIRYLSAVFLIFTVFVMTVYAVYQIFSEPATLVVSSHSLTLSPTAQNVTRYHNATLTATLKKDGVPVMGALIYLVHQNGTVIYYNTTDTNGTCQLFYNVTEPEGSVIQVRAGYDVS